MEVFQGNRQIVHPDMIAPDLGDIEKTEPVYPLTAGLTNKSVRKAVQGALGFLPDLPEWLDPAFSRK